ncbi:MAG TPA: avidin/streptavidin family protein [Candidatus Acidoferrales bacterium]|nr:avidin/streptavidin family protein [Candidatus Acidoferrales bacterium]
MKRSFWLFGLGLFVICGYGTWARQLQNTAAQSALIGSWTNLNMEKGAATLNIISVDAATGEIKGKYIPPSGPAAGKEFGVVGWVSSAPPVEKADNVVVATFSVSLSTYGSVATWTGYFRDNKIIANWLNSRPNAGYEWDHITTGQDVWTRKK